MLLLVLILSLLILRIDAQPLCTFAYSPCDPQDVTTGVCVDAPGEQCYQDINMVVYCCVPPPNDPTTQPPPVFCTPAPTLSPPPFTGICADVLPCCNPSYCSSYPTEMAKICPLSCGYCIGVVGGTGMTQNNNGLSLMGCSDSSPACSHKKNLCNSPDHKEKLRQQCAYTCGYCNRCEDHKNDCNVFASNGYCTGSRYTTNQTRAFCARTCGYCGGISNCFDRDPNCPIWKRNGFCRSTYFSKQQIQSYCAKSCNMCTGISINPNCVDKDASCPLWRTNGFCTNEKYSAAQRKSYCPRTCNLC